MDSDRPDHHRHRRGQLTSGADGFQSSKRGRLLPASLFWDQEQDHVQVNLHPPMGFNLCRNPRRDLRRNLNPGACGMDRSRNARVPRASSEASGLGDDETIMRGACPTLSLALSCSLSFHFIQADKTEDKEHDKVHDKALHFITGFIRYFISTAYLQRDKARDNESDKGKAA